MVFCKVTITMPDGSKGHHEDDYPDTVAATIRAQELFPEARKIEVWASGSLASGRSQRCMTSVSSGN